MKFICIALLGATVMTRPALADLALAQQKKCMVCHTLEKRIVGPSYVDVAKKYAGQNVSARLAAKISEGDAGTWGVVPMPANPKVSRDDADTLAKWVLSLK